MGEDHQDSDHPKGSRLAAALSCHRPVVGIALLAVLLHVVPLRTVLQRLKAADPFLLALGFTVVLGAMLTSALKLWLLVRTAVPEASFLGVLRAYYVGSFFNNLLPTTVGGDVVKINEMLKGGVPVGHAVASVVVERGTGVLVVLALAAIVSLCWGGLLDTLNLQAVRWPLAASSAGAFVLLVALYAAWRTKLKSFLKARRGNWALGRLYRAIESFYVFRDRPLALALACGLSVFLYALVATNIVVIAHALRANVAPSRALGIIPILKIPEMLPVSVGGLGIREGMLTYCLGRLGLAHAEALGAALLLRALSWVHSALGGCIYALGRRAARPAP